MRGLNQVWRALDQARPINLAAAGEPPALPQGAGISRRRVLAALGAHRRRRLPRWPAFASAPLRVAIVGGGLAGLSRSSRCAPAASSLAYEGAAAAGGRTRSVHGVFAPDFAFDEGAQLVNSDHADLLRLIRRFDLNLVDRRAYGETHEIQIGHGGGPESEAALAASLLGIAGRITADSDRLDRDYEAVARELDPLSVKAYLDRHGLPPGPARDALEATIRTEYGVEPEEASALELLFNLPTVDGERISRISASDERYLIAGGTDQVAKALAAEHRGHIHLNRRVTALDLTGPAPRLAFADGSHVTADRIILALPAPLLREVRIDGPLPPLWRALIAEARLGRNEKLIVYDAQPPAVARFCRQSGRPGTSAIWDGLAGAVAAFDRRAHFGRQPGRRAAASNAELAVCSRCRAPRPAHPAGAGGPPPAGATIR